MCGSLNETLHMPNRQSKLQMLINRSKREKCIRFFFFFANKRLLKSIEKMFCYEILYIFSTNTSSSIEGQIESSINVSSIYTIF